MPRSTKQPPIPILHVRGLAAILDADLARLYGVTTGAINQAVSRNQQRFPEDFTFMLTKHEWDNLKCQNGASSDPDDNLISQSVISSSGHGGRRKLPRVFTEDGALMASTVLRSDEATRMSLFVIRAFVRMREALAANATILRRLAEIDRTLLLHDSALRDLYQKLLPLLQPPPDPPKRPIGFRP